MRAEGGAGDTGKARVAREQDDGAQGAVAILAPGRVAVKCQRADAMKKSVRSTDPCEPAGTMHVRCERYVARALEIFGERQSACGAKIHWRVSSRGEAGAPHVRATKGSDRAGRGEEEWHAQRVGLLLRRWREVSYQIPFMVQPP